MVLKKSAHFTPYPFVADDALSPQNLRSCTSGEWPHLYAWDRALLQHPNTATQECNFIFSHLSSRLCVTIYIHFTALLVEYIFCVGHVYGILYKEWPCAGAHTEIFQVSCRQRIYVSDRRDSTPPSSSKHLTHPTSPRLLCQTGR